MLFISGRSVLIRSHLNPSVFPIYGFPNHRIGEVQARLGLMLMDKLGRLAAAALEILKPPNSTSRCSRMRGNGNNGYLISFRTVIPKDSIRTRRFLLNIGFKYLLPAGTFQSSTSRCLQKRMCSVVFI